MNDPSDLLVIGGGPAGAAAAIWGAAAGLGVRLIERSAEPQPRPGETLHPGVAAILDQLGVRAPIEEAAGLRTPGQIVRWGSSSRFAGYGDDARGAWRGYQILRPRLLEVLHKRARHLGVAMVTETGPLRPLIEGGRMAGASARDGTFPARIIIDASGTAGWLRRHLRLPVRTCSPRLTAWFGYATGKLDRPPTIEGDRHGWLWTAELGSNLVHWTRLDFRQTRRSRIVPPCIAALPVVARPRGADVTWRFVEPCAGPGWFIAGDAAATLDPAASHGVLRALMSGMMAAHCARHALAGGEADQGQPYRRWMGDWFERDAQALTRLYRELNPDWDHVPVPGGGIERACAQTV